MGGPRITIDAAMFAATVRIHGDVEGDVGRIVARQQLAGLFGGNGGFKRRLDLALRLEVADVPFATCASFTEALAMQPPGRVDVIANYTAFQQIRSEFGRAV